MAHRLQTTIKAIAFLLLFSSVSFAQFGGDLLVGHSQAWNIKLNSTSAQPSITMQGKGKIYIKWGDGTAQQSYTLTSSDQVISHTYSVAGNYTRVIYNASAVTKWSTSSNCAWSFDLSSVSRSTTYFTCTGSNTITGNLSSLPSTMTFFRCYGSNTITGNLSSLPSVMTYFDCQGSNTITGNLSSLPSMMTYFVCYGSNTITGNLSSLPSVMTTFVCTGNNNTINAYTAGHVWASAMNYFYVTTNSGGLTSAMVDSLCIDLDAVPWGGSGRTLHLTGAGIGAPTSASAAARTDLTNVKLVTVTTN